MKATIKFEDGRTAEIELTQEQVELIKSSDNFERYQNVVTAGHIGFSASHGIYRKNKLHSFKSEKDAQLLADRFNLEMEMFRWASENNGGWIPDWDNEQNWGIYFSKRVSRDLRVEKLHFPCSVIFGLAFKTEEIAEGAKQIFGDRILSIYGKQF